MSADNYRTCPRCKKQAEAARSEAEAKAKAGYGKLPLDQYEALRTKASEPLKVDTEGLAEYIDCRITDSGKFIVEYSAGCRACGFEFSYRHSEEVKA